MSISSIKKAITSTFWGEYAVSNLHCIECAVLPKLISDEEAVKRFYKKKTGKTLNLENPKTFSEKMNWYKLNHRDPLMQQCADKVAVRDYVISAGYKDLLNEVYGVYDKVSDIDIYALPEKFVLKASHGSHMNIIVKDKKTLNWNRAKLLLKSWMRQDIYWSGREWVYKDIPKRIIAERYLEDGSGGLQDYKFFCFNGKPEILQIDIDRMCKIHYRNYYDLKTKTIMEMSDNEKLPRKAIKIDDLLKETQLEDMVGMATTLSQPFEQARIDLYLVKNKIYFGEITFFDGGGSTTFSPEKYNYVFGEKWEPKTQ